MSDGLRRQTNYDIYKGNFTFNSVDNMLILIIDVIKINDEAILSTDTKINFLLEMINLAEHRFRNMARKIYNFLMWNSKINIHIDIKKQLLLRNEKILNYYWTNTPAPNVYENEDIYKQLVYNYFRRNIKEFIEIFSNYILSLIIKDREFTSGYFTGSDRVERKICFYDTSQDTNTNEIFISSLFSNVIIKLIELINNTDNLLHNRFIDPLFLSKQFVLIDGINILYSLNHRLKLIRTSINNLNRDVSATPIPEIIADTEPHPLPNPTRAPVVVRSVYNPDDGNNSLKYDYILNNLLLDNTNREYFVFFNSQINENSKVEKIKVPPRVEDINNYILGNNQKPDHLDIEIPNKANGLYIYNNACDSSGFYINKIDRSNKCKHDLRSISDKKYHCRNLYGKSENDDYMLVLLYNIFKLCGKHDNIFCMSGDRFGWCPPSLKPVKKVIRYNIVDLPCTNKYYDPNILNTRDIISEYTFMADQFDLNNRSKNGLSRYSLGKQTMTSTSINYGDVLASIDGIIESWGILAE